MRNKKSCFKKLCAARNNVICNNWRLFIASIFFLICSPYLAGCTAFTKTAPAGDETSKLFYDSYDDTWNSVISALGVTPLEVVDKHKGYIKTKWVESRSEKEGGGLLFAKHWKERYRLTISVTSLSALDKSTEVSIVVHAEEKAAAGTRAFSWQRKASDGAIENMLFKKIENLL